jgi:hypothetical protein
MNDEEKALEIANNIVQKLSDRFRVEEWNEFSKTDLIIAALEAMDYKNKQFKERIKALNQEHEKHVERLSDFYGF